MAAIFLSNDHSLYAPIYLGWIACLISFVGTSRPARSASKAKKCKMKNPCSEWDSNPGPWDLKSDALQTELTRLRCKLYYLNDNYMHVYMYFLYQSYTNVFIGICSRIMKCSVFCLVNIVLGPWMSTVVLYVWCHSDIASVLLYFTF